MDKLTGYWPLQYNSEKDDPQMKQGANNRRDQSGIWSGRKKEESHLSCSQVSYQGTTESPWYP